MPFGQSPWMTAAGGMENMGNSMANIARAQMIGRMRAQEFAQQIAIRQAQEEVQRERMQNELSLGQQRLDMEAPEYSARTKASEASATETNQKVQRQTQMDELAHQLALAVTRQRFPGGVMPSGGPSIENAQRANQMDVVRNAIQLMGMKDPNGVTTMMMGKNIPRGDVNYNPITQERIEGLPPAAPSGAPIDPDTGMTPYQFQQLLLQKSRMADEEKRTEMIMERLKMDPKYQFFKDDSTDDEAGGGGSTPKQLDAATAKRFLDQANGDKEKARALAKQQGYTF